MALKTPDTKHEQDTSHNPSQEYYDSKFNEIAAANKTAENLKDQEGQVGNTAGDLDEIENYANDPANASRNVNKTKEKEEGGGWQTNVANKQQPKEEGKKGFLQGLKRKGPLGFLIALVLGAGTLGFSGFALMPLSLTEHMTNDTNDSKPSSQRKNFHLFGKKVNGSDFKKKLSICNSVVSFRCKMKTIPEPLADAFEKEGKFKFHDKNILPDGRIGFSALEFPDGNVAHDSGELTRILRTSASSSLAFEGIYNTRNSLYTGNWFSKMLAGINLTKGKKIEGNTREATDRSYQESVRGERGTISTSATPGSTDENATEEQRRQTQANNDAGNETSRQINEAISKGTKLKSLALKASGALALPQMACLTYNMANFIATTAKIKKAMYFAGFAMIFLTLASTIKANAATSAEVETAMSVLAPSKYPEKVEDPTTGQMIDNPNIGKNALDSEAYKVVAYGDQINLVGVATKFFVAGGFLGVLQKVLTWIDSNIGKSKMKIACKLVNNKVVQVVSFLAAPIITGIGLIAQAVLPLDEWAANLVNFAIDAATGVDPTTDLLGVDAGNALFVGVAAIMGTASMKFGMKPGKLSAIKQNVMANEELQQQEIAMETYAASKTPLDITNRYSFLGSMAFQLASLMPNFQRPVVSSIGKVFAAIPQSFAALTKNASAAYSMPVADYSETRFNQCKDEVYAAFKEKFSPDMFCSIRYVPFDAVDVDVVFDYLEASNQIDKITAEPIAGSYTDKFVKFCANRTDPWGSTSIPAEEQTEDPKWYTGEMCLEDTKDNQMTSEYIGYKISEETIDQYPKPSPTKQAFFDGDTETAKSGGGLSGVLSRATSFMLGGAH